MQFVRRVCNRLAQNSQCQKAWLHNLLIGRVAVRHSFGDLRIGCLSAEVSEDLSGQKINKTEWKAALDRRRMPGTSDMASLRPRVRREFGFTI